MEQVVQAREVNSVACPDLDNILCVSQVCPAILVVCPLFTSPNIVARSRWGETGETILFYYCDHLGEFQSQSFYSTATVVIFCGGFRQPKDVFNQKKVVDGVVM